MTTTDERLRLTLGRRVLAMRQEYGMMWRRRETMQFIDRLTAIYQLGEGVDDVDLRVLVRLYHREIMGRRHEEQNI